jgi:hypothetical protein
MKWHHKLKTEILHIGQRAISTTWTLLKIMIPISIIVKTLQILGFIEIVGIILSPVMNIVGLPGETGLIWATAMITNIYGGILVFVTLANAHMFSIAEVTVLGTMILIAHSLPVEVSIARKAGVRAWFTLILRIGCALLLGSILHILFTYSGVLSENANTTWQLEPVDGSLLTWGINQLKNYTLIFLIIFSLLLFMDILEKIGIIEKINKFLEPGLRTLGISKDAAPLTIIGITLGLSYGGGLIIQETHSEKLTKKDAFLSVSLMGLSHSLFEDTILMLTLGASLIGVLFSRIIFTILIIIIIVQLISRIPHDTFLKYFYHRKES